MNEKRATAIYNIAANGCGHKAQLTVFRLHDNIETINIILYGLSKRLLV